MAEEKSSAFFTNLDELKSSLENDQHDDSSVLRLPKKAEPEQEQWFTEDYEGQLAVDVFQTKDNIIVKSTIAGIKPEDLEIYVHNDLLTIRGKREDEKSEEGTEYFYKECYWGGFSRSVILPVEVQVDKVAASMKNGVLTIIMPKATKSKLVNVQVKEE
jgi:HSP20 family protein